MQEAIAACRRGKWNEGLPLLAKIAEEEQRSGKLPAIVYSYLGYGIALRQQRFSDGLRLCQHAVRLEFYQPEAYLNLAKTQLLAGNRRGAIRALEDGLDIDPSHGGLLELQQDVGHRRRPVLPFLSRTNPINSFLGRVRHLFT